MKLRNKITTGILLSASALALAGCSTGTIDEAVAEFDGIQTGTFEMEYEVNSVTYGEYGISVTGQFDKVDDADDTQAKANTSLVQTVHATELEDVSEEQEFDETELIDINLDELSEEEIEELSQEMSTISLDEGVDIIVEENLSRGYNYQIEEVNRVYVDGQETTSTGEMIALGDTLYDKVFLTGSEANGRFVYDSRDVGITEYPITDFIEVSPIIESFDLGNSDIEVETGDLANGDSGHVFTVTPEQAVTALQEEASNSLVQNILGIVTEANVDSVVIGVSETSFTVEAISTGTEESVESEGSEEANGEATVIGSLVLTKTAGTVDIQEPANAMDLDEFTSLVELFYQQQAEQQLDEQLLEEEVYGEEIDIESGELDDLGEELNDGVDTEEFDDGVDTEEIVDGVDTEELNDGVDTEELNDGVDS